MTIYERLKRRDFRRLKKKGIIKSEYYDEESLEILGLELVRLHKSLQGCDRALSRREIVFLIEIETLIKTLDLILSEDTDYGYLSKQYEFEVI